jgi:hypothetical protein
VHRNGFLDIGCASRSRLRDARIVKDYQLPVYFLLCYPSSPKRHGLKGVKVDKNERADRALQILLKLIDKDPGMRLSEAEKVSDAYNTIYDKLKA